MKTTPQFHLFLTCVLWLGLTACSNNKLITDKFYTLTLTSTPHSEQHQFKQWSGVIAVKQLNADDFHSQDAIVYSLAETPLELSHYHYHRWIEPLPKLIQNQLIQYLRASAIARVVALESARTSPQYSVSGNILQFLHQITTTSGNVVVAITLQLEQESNGKLLFVKDYITKTTILGDGMYAVIEAFTKALRDIAVQFAKDIQIHLQDKPL